VFILVGFLTSFFSKNMTVIMVITLALANIIRVILRGEPEFEGMEDGSGDADTAAAGEAGKDAQKPKEKEPDANKKGADADAEKKDASSNDESKMVNELKSDAQDLIDAQEKIIAGFGTISPHMDAAENLINKINRTAEKIEGLRTGSSLTGGSSMKMEPFTEGAAVRKRTANAQGQVREHPQAPMPRNMVRALERARAAEGAHNKK
jgi:hypothetical protein